MPVRARDAGRSGHVFERAVAAIAIQRVLAAGQARRAAGDRDALVAAQARIGRRRRRRDRGRCSWRRRDRAGRRDRSRGTRSPCPSASRARERPPRAVTSSKRAVAPVVIQTVLAPVGDEQIVVAVVVVVAGAGALAPAARAEPGRRGHVRECAVALVAVEMVASARCPAGNPSSVDRSRRTDRASRRCRSQSPPRRCRSSRAGTCSTPTPPYTVTLSRPAARAMFVNEKSSVAPASPAPRHRRGASSRAPGRRQGRWRSKRSAEAGSTHGSESGGFRSGDRRRAT